MPSLFGHKIPSLQRCGSMILWSTNEAPRCARKPSGSTGPKLWLSRATPRCAWPWFEPQGGPRAASLPEGCCLGGRYAVITVRTVTRNVTSYIFQPAGVVASPADRH